MLILPVEEESDQDHHSPYSDVEQVQTKSSQNYERHRRSEHPTPAQLIAEVFHPCSNLVHERDLLKLELSRRFSLDRPCRLLRFRARGIPEVRRLEGTGQECQPVDLDGSAAKHSHMACRL